MSINNKFDDLVKYDINDVDDYNIATTSNSDDNITNSNNNNNNNINRNGVYAMDNESILRDDLKFFFMNPIDKWRHRRRFPFKLLTLVIKIILVTVQLCVFAGNRNEQFNYLYGNKMSFSHLFLYGWDSTREIKSYPPAAGPLAIYKLDKFYRAIDYALTGYGNLSNTIGPYSYIRNATTGRILPVKLCKKQFVRGNSSSNSSIREQTECCLFDVIDNNRYNNNNNHRYSNNNNNSDKFNADDPFSKCNMTRIDFSRLIKITLEFSLKTSRIYSNRLRCTVFSIFIVFDNSDHVGRLLLNLDLSAYRTINCRIDSISIEDEILGTDEERRDFTWRISAFVNWLNYVVIIVCLISLVLCVRAVYRAQLLKRRTIAYFLDVRRTALNVECRLLFWNFWYLTIIANDVMIIIGTYMQESIFHQGDARNEWTICSLLLGTGNLLVWFGVLRYFGFFKTYNVVMITVISAFPAVLRFMACAVLIYCGFMFCGWLVFGPYHMKFRTLSSTSECLFSLINGDDMFATFSIFEASSPLLIVYMRVYLYCFTGLFIYVILSLLLSIIIDAYETIKEYYEAGFPKTDVQEFIGEQQQQRTNERANVNEDGEDETSLLNSNVNPDGVTFKQFLSNVMTCVTKT